ncbi:hypothetical protein M973_04325 [Francisella orientalis LADL 07-285A]|nr:hypothetical protein M973_04325 [Francisella orientalis LADL 07-285A]
MDEKQQVARVCLDQDETLIMFTLDADLVKQFPVTLEQKKSYYKNLSVILAWKLPIFLIS